MTVALGIAAVVVLLVLVVFTTARRRDGASAVRASRPASTPSPAASSGREYERMAQLARRTPGTDVATAADATPAAYVPPDPEQLGVTRRQFFNRSIVAMMGLSVSGFGTAALAFLWPSAAGGFGSDVNAGNLEDILATIESTREPFYVPEGRFFINPYPTESLTKASAVYSGGVLTGMEAGVVALYQKCVHLGCRVPWCDTSQWFECPCHGSQYNRVGEKKGGPAPRGLDRFPVTVSGGNVMVATGTVIQGPPIGVNTTGQEAEGPHCVSGGH